MSPKKLQKDKLTLAQESYITLIYLAEKQYPFDDHHFPCLWVSGNFFVMHLGVHWKNYHRKLMVSLVETGWVKKKTIGGTIFYSITDMARFAKDDHSVHANKNIQVERSALPF